MEPVEPVVDVMEQAAAVAESIDVLFAPRFYAYDFCRSLNRGQKRWPVLVEYNSPKRPGPPPSFVPRDWQYLVTATTQVPCLYVETHAICGPLDEPDRKLGRAMSLMRLAGVLVPRKYEVWAEGRNRAIKIPPLKE